jgi:tetratricopeptide (TPR) repeat protein
MRPIAIIFVIVCGVIAGAIVYVKRSAAPASPVPVAPAVQASTETATAPAPAVQAPAPGTPHQTTESPAEAAAVPTASPTPAATTNLPIAKAVDALLNAKSGLEKHNLFQQLVKAGQIDDVIAELKQRMADNPTDAEIPTTLGEAQLNELKALKDSGADNNALGILALQADQSFNAALKIDPQNWEAQFVKASSMYYWPANPDRDSQVVQQLSSLIDQQDTMSSQPDFAQTYVVLGNEYQKIGQSDKAMATWQLGLQKYPSDSGLQGKVNGQ